MKKVLITLCLIFVVNPVYCYQYNQYDTNNASSQSNQPTKVYNKYGSYQGKLSPQSNGRTKVYDKTGSYQGYFKQSGTNKVKYYNR